MNAPEQIDFDAQETAREFMLGKLIKASTKRFKSLAVPYMELRQGEQQTILREVEEDIRKAIRQAVETDVELAERMLVEAFAGGWANTKHYDGLANMRNVMVLGAAYKDDKSTLHICDAMRIIMANLRDRYAKTERMGVTGEMKEAA